MICVLICYFFFVYQDTTDVGLDLDRLMTVVAEVKTASELEERLNSDTSELAINNVDLNEDGEVDYISVREKRVGDYNNGQVFFVLEVDDKIIAEVEFQSPKSEKKTSKVIVTGSKTYFGPDVVYVHYVDRYYHPFWTKNYWGAYIYVSPYRHVHGKKRLYPTYWKHRRAITRTAYRERATAHHKKYKRRVQKKNVQKKVKTHQKQNVQKKVKNHQQKKNQTKPKKQQKDKQHKPKHRD
jgi:hypothetical protein